MLSCTVAKAGAAQETAEPAARAASAAFGLLDDEFAWVAYIGVATR
jgi:hypothetical protein